MAGSGVPAVASPRARELHEEQAIDHGSRIKARRVALALARSRRFVDATSSKKKLPGEEVLSARYAITDVAIVGGAGLGWGRDIASCTAYSRKDLMGDPPFKEFGVWFAAS